MHPPPPYLTLESLLLHPLLGIGSSILLLIGFVGLGQSLVVSILRAESVHMIQRAAGFIVAVAAVSALVHLLALANLLSLANLRIVGLIIIAFGIAWGYHLLRHLDWRLLSKQLTGVGYWNATERLITGICAVMLVCLFATSLGPTTHIDAISYHVSVPLHWLANEGAVATPFWLHSRLVGLGESIIILGLACGTDSVGSVFQAAGVVTGLISVCSVARGTQNRFFGVLAVSACPIWISLVATSKPQMLPTAASAVAFGMILKSARSAQRLPLRSLVLIGAATSYAASCKYSFLPSAVLLALIGFFLSCRGTHWGHWAKAVTVLVVAFGAGPLQISIRNVAFYGDPLSPALESLRSDPDPVIRSFSWYLRNCEGEHTLSNLVQAPLRLILPRHQGAMVSVIGLAAFCVFFTVRFSGIHGLLFGVTLFLTLFNLAFGQLTGRFFTEPFLWTVLLATAVPWTRGKTWLQRGLLLQAIGTIFMATFAMISLLPGALTPEGKEATLVRYANSYNVARWLNQQLSDTVVIASDQRLMLYSNRPAIPHDFAHMLWMTKLDNEEKSRRLNEMLRACGATHLVVSVPVEKSDYGSLHEQWSEPVLRSPVFRDSVRNPFREGDAFQVTVYDLRDLTPEDAARQD